MRVEQKIQVGNWVLFRDGKLILQDSNEISAFKKFSELPKDGSAFLVRVGYEEAEEYVGSVEGFLITPTLRDPRILIPNLFVTHKDEITLATFKVDTGAGPCMISQTEVENLKITALDSAGEMRCNGAFDNPQTPTLLRN